MAHYKAVASFYDDEYADNPNLVGDVALYLKHLPKKPQRILILAAGTGRDAITLAQAGHSVTGIDFDPRVLEIAEFKRDSLGIAKSQLKFLKRDMRDLRLAGTFDHAVILFNSFLVLTETAEQKSLLRVVRKHLAKRGTFWIDIFNPNMARLAEPVAKRIDPHLFFSRELGRSVMRTVTVRDTGRPQVRRVDFDYEWHDDAGMKKTRRVGFDLAYMMPRELVAILESAGFEIIGLFGDHQGGEVTHDSPRLIAHARRI